MIGSLALVLLAAVTPFISAQESSTCDPLTATCAPDPGINAPVTTIDFTKTNTLPSGWQLVNQGSVTYDNNGAHLILAKQGDSPILETTGYILFGQLSVTVLAASGQGIVSSLVLLSDDLDELDWEFTGTDTTQVQSNYFGKGITTNYDRAAWHSVASPQTTVHTYTFDWTPSAVTWSIDGAAVRTLNYADAAGGAQFPQTPMRVRLGIWAGGDPSNGEGTIEWSGGPTNYANAPFVMTVQSVTVKNYSPGSSYTYGDTSGSYESIQIAGGTLMSNNGGGSNGITTATGTTSLSYASEPTQNPLTAAATTSAVKNITNQTTLSTLPKSTGSPSGAGSNPSNAALRPDAADMTTMSSMLLGAVALGMGLFF